LPSGERHPGAPRRAARAGDPAVDDPGGRGRLPGPRAPVLEPRRAALPFHRKLILAPLLDRPAPVEEFEQVALVGLVPLDVRGRERAQIEMLDHVRRLSRSISDCVSGSNDKSPSACAALWRRLSEATSTRSSPWTWSWAARSR